MSRLPTTACLITAYGTALFLSACSADRPTAASSGPDDEAIGQTPSFSEASAHDDGWLKLVSISGPGRGRIKATRIEHPTTPGNFAVRIEIQVRRAPPNTTYLVQRAPEVSPPFGINPTTTDGSCQRGLDIAPWSTVTPTRPASFLTFPVTVPPPSAPQSVRLTTDARGRGELEFDFAAGVPFPAFDVMFRLLEDSPAPRSVLVSECTTLAL